MVIIHRAGSSPALGTRRSHKPNMSISSHTNGAVQYFQKGTKPSLLILSGMHGDESEIATCVATYISAHSDTFPEYVYIPQVSPSAMQQRTRVNAGGHDINRKFKSTTDDPEVHALIKILSQHIFSLCVDFHEDPDLSDEVYMYDTGRLISSELDTFKQTVVSSGFQLHTGIDDPLDTNLGYDVEDGYVSMQDEVLDDTGFASDWMIRHGVTKRVFTLEVPGKASNERKRALVNILFPFFLSSKFMIQ